MTRIVMDEKLPERLAHVTEPVELCDTAGVVVGRFIPKFDPSQWEIVPPLPTEEELRRIQQSNEPNYTTREVLAYLENL